MKPLYLFYILVFYIVAQFCWWAYSLVSLNNEVYEHRIENVSLKYEAADQVTEIKKLESKQNARWWMFIGEGSVFLILLGIGCVVTYKSFYKEVALARMQKNFLLSVTHEFKSPLASIKLYLQTLLKHDLEKSKQTSFLNSAIRDSDRLNQLVENTLLANTIDHKGYFFNKEHVNLSALIRLGCNHFASLPENKHEIKTEIEDNIDYECDKTSMIVLLNNLLSNAGKYSPSDSEIKVQLKKENHKFILTVSDYGLGIEESERKKIFNKFYRVGNELTRTTKGTGLGLFIVKHITDAHNAKIDVGSNQPNGAVFKITF